MKVLVIDDDPVALGMLEGCLRSDGHDVIRADGGRNGYEAARAQRPDVILLDLGMADLQGLDVLRLLKKDRELAQIPVLIVTASDLPDDKVEALDGGATDYIVKPFEPDEVRARVRAALRTHQAELILRANQNKFQSIFDGAPVPMLVVDPAGRVCRANAAASRIGGLPAEEIVGHTIGGGLGCVNGEHCGNQPACGLCGVRHAFASTLRDGGSRGRVAARIQPKDGSRCERHLLVTTTPLDFASQPMALVCLEDVTEQRAVEERLRRAALHDALTGLPNRALLAEHMWRAMDRLRRDASFRFAVMFLDFDRFKVVNDSLGHQAGDQLLMAISRRLSACLREWNCSAQGRSAGEIARLGGDEFVVLVEGSADSKEACELAERMQNCLAEAFHVAGHEIHTTASIGIVLSDGKYADPQEMLRDADLAMYRAKDAGRACCALFNHELHSEAMASLKMENDLRRAIDRQELFVVYQPIVSLESGQVHGFEALVRWNHPQLGIISPDRFIPLSEETGLIVPLGRFVLREACRQLRALHEQFPRQAPLSMSVNLSKRQLADRALAACVRSVLHETGVAPASLQLEVTETVIVEQAGATGRTLSDLKAIGLKLAMDDFGTGCSSLSRLHQLPIDVLKIDRAFVGNMGLNTEYAAIVQAIVMLAHNLRMSVVAEGIETEGQLAQLQALDCDLGQGYFFAKPLPAHALPGVLAMGSWARKSA